MAASEGTERGHEAFLPLPTWDWALQSMDGGPGGLRGVTEGQTRLKTVIEETPARHPQ